MTVLISNVGCPDRYSDAELVGYLRDFEAEYGRPPTTHEARVMDDVIPPSPSTYMDRFGSWGEAHEAAGFEACPYSARPTRDDYESPLAAKLPAALRQLGEQLREMTPGVSTDPADAERGTEVLAND